MPLALPPLPYACDAPAPATDEQTMRIDHGERTAVRNTGGGHANHSLFRDRSKDDGSSERCLPR
jgi:superoxide dismutase